MNWHYNGSLIIAEDLTNKIDKIIEESYKDGREAGKSDLMDVLDEIITEIKSSIDADDTDGYSDYRAGLWQAIKIIDKYKTERDEV